ncbi:MAG: FkbM family methyltransferase, partial [Candidatus Eiseniibacteriota bacterium]
RDFYSQFGEDAFLQGYFEAKAFELDRGVRLPFARPTISKGFYVDVGAFSPKEASNTYFFYRRGWRGINIDAAPGSMEAFRWTRRRDVNLEVAISETAGEMSFYFWSTHAYTNTLSADHAREHERLSGVTPREIRVPTRTLTSVLDEHPPPASGIDFLSVDAEGHDLQVLRSLDWSRYRPELALVEDDHRSLDGIARSVIATYLRDVGYSVCAWIPPTVVYRRDDPR